MNKNKSTIDWLMIFTKDHRSFYIVSVILAILGVICSIVPYMIIGDMATKLINGNKDFQIYLNETMIMCLFWILRIAFHSLSTLCSHTATFRVLAHIRKLVCDKLTIVPLGKIKDESSGTLKNVIVERIDSIETTLAHVVPEFAANLMAPVIVTIYLFIIDWRIALAALIIMPLGFLAYCGMMIGYEESFRNTITKTKILNDTAVEYINGIEVIKAFGKAQNSYEKFKIAAQEGADCYIEWMRRSNIFFSIAMVLAPCTMLTVLPIGGYFVMNQTLSIIDFIMCIILSLGLTVPIITVASYSDDIGKMTAIVDKIVNILTWKPLDRPTHSQELPSDYSIQLDKVTFAYNDIDVLHDICMNIKQGTFNAFVGPSGSGKSTIAKLIASLWDVKKGNISIGGINIKDLSLEDCNQMIVYVSQDNYLLKPHLHRVRKYSII
ncbi:MAG: ABC transporter ATP-binding protein/permease [Erysipelotrichaceae bacterium]|nr:ABC transporter ATP-binding protein/permease [Erysipelotrichaceae bacterium]